MHRRRFLMPAAVVGSVGIALTPALASASTPAQPALTHQITGAVSPLSANTGAAFKKFSSPLSKSIRVQKAQTAGAARLDSRVAAGDAATGTVIYATTADFNCSPDTGNGTVGDPYCNLQDAVDAASPGDTIDVAGAVGYFSESPVTITTSDLTIVGTSSQSWLAHTPGAAITLDGVSGVTISNMMLAGTTADVAIENSSDITLDSDYLGGYAYGDHDGVTIDGTSSGITVSRSYVDTGGWGATTDAVRIASGASKIVLASDLIAYSQIAATDVAGLDITGDTIQRGCDSGIDVEGASTGVYLENNVLEDSNSYVMGPSASQCQSDGDGWAPDITVAAASTAGTTSDYNDFDVLSGDTTSPYSWNGADYATTAAFVSATGQGAHDTNDTTTFEGVYVRANESANIQAVPGVGSPAIRSANTSAPGELASDFYGVSPYNTRGAVQVTPPNPDLSTAVSVTDSSAFGVSATVTTQGYGTATSSGLTVVVDWGDGTSSTTSSTDATIGHTYAKLGEYTVSVTASDGSGDTASNSVSGVQTAGSEYTAYGPVRILDTRSGIGASASAVAPKGIVKLKVAGAGTAGNPIPSGVTAVVLNVTVTQPSANGFLTVYPDQDGTGAAESVPTTSNLNFAAGQTVPNLVVVPVGPNGVIDFYNGSSGHTQVIADVSGYFTQQAASGYVSITPVRLMDTRSTAKIPANGSVSLTVAGAKGLPSTGITAVAANLTVADSTSNGFITAYPAGGTMPNVSNVNYAAHQIVPNMAIVPVSSKGQVTFHNTSNGPVDLIVDAFGYYTSNGSHGTGASAYLPLPTPDRWLDTRNVDGEHDPMPGDYPFGLPFTDASDVTGAVINATVVQPQTNGFLSLFPYEPSSPGAVPSTSNVNFAPGQIVPNLVIVSPGTQYDSTYGSYDIGVYLNSNGYSDVILDVFGIFVND